MKILTATAVAALTAAAAFADPVAYEFDRGHTEISASWMHQGLSRQSLQFTDYEGTLLLDFENPENSSVDITFSLIDGLWAGAHHDRFIGHLNSAEVFNTAEFPTAHFVATGFETEDGVTGTMSGDLTIIGVTVPVTLDVTLNDLREDGTAGFTATGTLVRSDWGPTIGIYAGPVSDEVVLTINTELSVAEDDAE
ncbi:MAG: polyisoprenoid-binding protein [Rhodobacterales bacterium CG15_BIG_FIL_POST_REV_8_21_14_020_59_13]|nr:MAG: polyisoprenoid-binding protein [Rhodobacterales bacterium CG15_BIG_FIL_POST_REV_8_21_14_020_59_13]